MKLQLANSVLLLTLLCAAVSMHPGTVSAQMQRGASPSAATESAVLDERTAEELGKRIQRALEEKREQVKGVISQLLSEKKALIGEVERVTDGALTIQSPTGTAILTIEDVQLLKQERPIELDDIAVGNWVTVVGIREKNTVEPEFIWVSTESLRPKPQQVFLGTVTQLNRSSITVQPRAQDAPKTVEISSSTEIQDPDGGEVNLSDLSEDITVLVTGVVSDDELTASTIRSLAPLE